MNDKEQTLAEPPKGAASVLNDGLYGWLITEALHVMPLNDLREHTEDTECWCDPTDDGEIVVHHSADNREAFEARNRKPS